MDSFIDITPAVALLKVPFSGIWTGVYLVRHEKTILIDSGTEAALVDSVIVPALAERGLKPSDIDVLLCTHCHGDHIGGHARLKELGVQTIGATRPQEPKLKEPLTYSKKIRAVFPDDSPAPPPVLDGVTPDFILEDGDEIDSLHVIYTPGHDSECACFFEITTKALITGDSLQGNGTDTQGIALVMYLQAYRNSLNAMKIFHPEHLIPGHDFHPFDQYPLNTQENCRKAIDDSQAMLQAYEDFIIEKFNQGVTDVHVIARELILSLGGTIPKFLFLPLYTVTQTIQKLC